VLADDNSGLSAVLQERYATMKSAMAVRDNKAVAALLATDFVSVDISGQSKDAAEMIQEIDALPKDPLRVSTTTIVSATQNGNTAIVLQRYDMKTIKTASDGSAQNVELVTISTDTWVNLNGVWLFQRTETDLMDYYVNGQQVAHKVRG
jgi:ketosteroid isomerase-like protein